MIDPSQLTWWNDLQSHLSPTLLTLFGGSFFSFGDDPLGGGFPIRFYGLMYLAAFFTCFHAMKAFIKRDRLNIPDSHMDALLTWVVLGILLGGRFGYVFFYQFEYYMNHPLEIILPFRDGQFTGIAGMSYHGGLLGAILGGYLCLRREKVTDFWPYLNVAFLCAPLGYTWGRLGNFLNGELYGRPTDSAIGMLFPSDPQQVLRHPSQLYEMFGEGLILFGILLFCRRFALLKNQMLPLYVFGYGFIRFQIEFFREPDAHLGLRFLGMSRGQELCALMMLAGLALFTWRHFYVRRKQA